MFSIIFALLSLTLVCPARQQNKPNQIQVRECFDDICIGRGYSTNVPPNSGANNNQPITVNMSFQLYNIISVDNDNNVIGMTLSLRQTWMENRIYPKKKSLIEQNGGWLPVPAEMGRNPETGIPQKVWMPKFFIYFLTDMDMKSNFQEQSLLWLSKVGQNRFMNYDSTFDLYLKCHMEYHRYPFDEHICPIKFSSSDLNATRLVLQTAAPTKWHRHKIAIGYFDIEILPLNEKEQIEIWEGERWSVAGFKLKLKRTYWRYIWNYYLSSGLFVLVSWVSFLVPTDDINARIALLITTLLVLVTVFNGVIENSPKAREGSTALGFWMFSMLVFVVLAFICHCIAMLQRKSKDVTRARTGKKMRQGMIVCGNQSVMEMEHGLDQMKIRPTITERLKTSLKKPDSHSLDFITLSFLLFLFIMYIILYSVVYKQW